MSKHQKREELIAFLFGRPGVTLQNLKFFRGELDVTTEDELCSVILEGFRQKESGDALITDDFPERISPVDIRAII